MGKYQKYREIYIHCSVDVQNMPGSGILSLKEKCGQVLKDKPVFTFFKQMIVWLIHEEKGFFQWKRRIWN